MTTTTRTSRRRFLGLAAQGAFGTAAVALLVGAVTDRGPAGDPRRHVDAAVVGVFWFPRLHWAVAAQFDLFPEFRGPLFDQWTSEAIAQILAGSA